MLTPPSHSPLPTFENFIAQRADERIVPLDIRDVAPILDELHLEMEATRLDANYRHSNPDEAAQCLYDWACRVLRRKMGREMNEVEQAYVRDKCESL